MPASSNCFRRRRHGEGESATRSDSSTLVSLPFSWRTCKILISVLSKVSWGIFAFRFKEFGLSVRMFAAIRTDGDHINI
ncbi:hypothetical protein NM604_2186 [Neisseria meningitidis NM604]|nr:hypothetical protein NM604_2186 [Neisseria meningitidis NM604]